MSKPYTAMDLMEIGVCGTEIDQERALATYADPANWLQIYSNGGKCEWAFIGPTRPGFELAQLALKKSNG